MSDGTTSTNERLLLIAVVTLLFPMTQLFLQRQWDIFSLRLAGALAFCGLLIAGWLAFRKWHLERRARQLYRSKTRKRLENDIRQMEFRIEEMMRRDDLGAEGRDHYLGMLRNMVERERKKLGS